MTLLCTWTPSPGNGRPGSGVCFLPRRSGGEKLSGERAPKRCGTDLCSQTRPEKVEPRRLSASERIRLRSFAASFPTIKEGICAQELRKMSIRKLRTNILKPVRLHPRVNCCHTSVNLTSSTSKPSTPQLEFPGVDPTRGTA